MKTAPCKFHRFFAICATILSSTISFASSSGSDGGDDDYRRPLSPFSSARLANYDSLFDEIKYKRTLDINRAIDKFIRTNFRGGEPTFSGLLEFKEKLQQASDTARISPSVAASVQKKLDHWQDYITALTTSISPSSRTSPAAAPLSPRLLTPAATREVNSYRRVLGDITNLTPRSSTTHDPYYLMIRRRLAEGDKRPASLGIENAGSADPTSSPVRTLEVAPVVSTPVDTLPEIPDLLTYLNDHIIGEETAMEGLAVGLHSHYKILEVNEELAAEGSDDRIAKENILLCGPTGCGKTASVRAAAKKLGRPFFEGDASGLTRTGYVGESAQSLITGLVEEAKSMVTDEVYGSPEYIRKVLDLVHKGMIFADELDKLAAKKAGSERDIAGSDVQAEFLKLIEGKKVTIVIKNGQLPPEVYEVDTSKILFIGGGAFASLPKKDNNMYAPDDFVEAGFKPELLGRFGNMVFLEGMTKEKFERILASPAASPIKTSLLLLERGYGIHVNFDAEAMKLIAERAYERSTGVRGLASMVRAALKPLIAQSATIRGSSITIDKAYIERHIPKVVRVKKDDRPPLGTHERFILDHPEPSLNMYM